MMQKLQSPYMKIIVKSLLSVSIVITVISLFNVVYFYYRSEGYAQTHAKKVTHEAAVMIEEKLREIETIINGIAAARSIRKIPDPVMKALLEKGLKSNNALFGIVIAYAPHQYSQQERLHSLYAIRKNDTVDFTTVEQSYDYTVSENEWYNSPLREGAVWSKPFWGKASKTMVVTYSVPVYKKNSDGSGRHIATISAVCSLANINNMLSSLDLGSSGYGFIIAKDGMFIAHPAEQLILDKITLTGYANENYSTSNQRIIEEGIRNFAPFLYQEPTKLTKQMGIISMDPIKSIGWFAGSVLVKSEISLSQKYAKRQWGYFILALTLSVSLFVLYHILIHEIDYRSQLPISSVIVTVAFVAGLMAIWGMEIAFGFPSPHEEKGFVADKGSLIKFIQANKQTASDQHKEHQHYIPTGILVNSVKLGSLNEVEISGTIWQKIPNSIASNADTITKEDVRFPSATKMTKEEAYRSIVGDTTIVGSNFTATLYQKFDNTLYPFDRLQVRIPIGRTQMLDNVQLVPDFSSYDVYVPSANPFVMKDLSIPGWRVKQTYFTLQKQDYPTTFGYADKSLTKGVNELALTITLQREIMASFILIFLPLFALAVIMYIALLLTSGDDKKINIFWFKPSNMTAVAGSFLLFLVFSTINLRNSIISDKILYVEYMFFLMYFVIFGLVVSSAKISLKNEQSIFGYRDGFIVKVTYWPIVMGSMFFITFAVFF